MGVSAFSSRNNVDVAQRICDIKMSFSLFASDAHLPPKGIREGLISGYMIPLSVRFDHINVSSELRWNKPCSP